LFNLIEAGEMTNDGLITLEYCLGDINEALEVFRNSETGGFIVKMINSKIPDKQLSKC